MRIVRQRLRKWLWRGGVLSLCFALFLVGSTLWSLFTFSKTKNLYPKLSYPPPSFSPEVTWSKTRPSHWVTLKSLPRAAWLSVIAAEDGGFFKHDGVEWAQSFAKIRSDLSKYEVPHGISTLNQQIVKNLYFDARPPITRKLQEMIVALRMDSELDKKRILEIYMNIAEWGPDIVGIGEAARYYFKKPATQLSDYECAVLANLLPNPRVRGAWVRSGRMPRKFTRLVQRTLRRLSFTSRHVKTQLLARQSNQ